MQIFTYATTTLLLGLVVWTGAGFLPDTAQATWYWCPDRPHAPLQAKPEAGCEPVVEKKEPAKKPPEGERVAPALQPDEIDAAIEQFQQRYRHFLSCCASDPAATSELRALDQQAAALLRQLEASFEQNTKVQKMLVGRGLLLSLIQARQQLRTLTQRRQPLEDSREKAGSLDYEAAGRARREAERLQETIEKDFYPDRPPSRAPTGPEIGAPSRFGPSIGTAGRTGAEIGTTSPAGPDIGTAQPSGAEIGRTPTTGPAIGTVPPTGTEIGDSDLNRR